MTDTSSTLRSSRLPHTVFITGATDGLGLSIARQLHETGSRVVMTGRKPLEQLDQSFFNKQNYHTADLVDSSSGLALQRFLKHSDIKRIDWLILNAATGYAGPFAGQTCECITDLIRVNLLSPIELTHRLLPWVKHGRGKIIFISSVVSALPCPEYAVYAATKSALDGFARSLRIEMEGKVRIQVIHPGATQTGIHRKSGLKPEAIRWDRFAPVESVARKIIRNMTTNRKECTIGFMNGLLRFAGKHLPCIVDRVFS